MTSTETKTKTCHNCAHWKALETETGECRRHAPQTIVFEIDDKTSIESRFPTTNEHDWCGDFERK
ncbi:MAG: hypothetical protein Q7Q71_14360 [Verrucomicrobiota bacterium JB023]|nr:hypothetical protein [Verrucomicrobiota bacterium JB023]